MRRVSSSTLLAVCATAAALLATAPAALATSALDQYQRTGRIDPCTASSGGGIPNDIEQYAPDFRAALQEALRQGCHRGGGAATGGGGGVSQTAPTTTSKGLPVDSNGNQLAAGSQYVPAPPRPTAPVRNASYVRHLPLASTSDVTTPAPVTALAIMALIALAAAALIAVWRYRGWGGHRLDPTRHAFGEAGARIGGAFEGLADRLRRGGRRRP